MARLTKTPEMEIEVVKPSEAGQYDPPMQEWLALPVGPPCLECESLYYDTENPRGYFLVRRCKQCGYKFRGEPSLSMINDIIEALMGRPRKFLR